MNIKPCPFCGSKVKHLTKFDVVYCSNVECGLHYENGGGYTREYWNTRPIEDKLKEAIVWAAYLAKGRHCTESEAMEWLELVKNNAIEDERTRNDPE